ncbi:MAG: hypothetical protein O7B81_17185, partial [Gammaproteobacteria bacterium]|nr:hypothetical protein [Gammaproteobacteria bacterium]
QVGNLRFIGSKIRKQGFPFVIHYGDLKAGDASCDDNLLSERRDLLFQLIEGGLFYTPGDNDWTDCDRPDAGSFDELERLDKIRSLFFSKGLPSKPEWRIARQGPDYPENARWTYGDLQFVTLHIVNSDNGRLEIEETEPTEKALDAVDARDRANLVWLDAAFDQAQQRDLDGLIVVIHADPGKIENREDRSRACTKAERSACNPYRPFLRRLTEQADRFDRPVLLVHGSSKAFCLDEGYGGWEAANLWRLDGPGDDDTVDAAVVRFDHDARVPFQVRGLLSWDTPSSCERR